MAGIPFGRYRLVALLGHRGMGEIWHAYDTATARDVALTLLPAYLARDRDFDQRFRREVHAAAEVNDPHLVPIHNFGEIEGRLYVDMRLIEGRELPTVLAGGPLTAERAVGLVTQICTAVDAVHQAGLVHGDVIPSNILVADRDFVYLMDFGITRTSEQTATHAGGFATATSPYLAPEQLTTGQTGRARDIFALTCVLYECLTGRQPRSADAPQQLLSGYLTASFPRPSEIRADVPSAFDAVIGKGLAANPGERYPSALQLADAARAALTSAPLAGAGSAFHSAPTQQRPLEAHRRADRAASPLRTWWRRKSVAIAAVAVMVGVGVTAVAVTGQSEHAGTSTSRSVPFLEASVFQRALLPVAEISSIVGDPNMKVTSSSGVSWHDHLRNVDNWACVGALYVAERTVYAGTGAGGSDIVVLDSAGDRRHHVEESAVLFATVDNNATSLFGKSLDQWRHCENTQVRVTSLDGSEAVWTIGAAQQASGSMITQSLQKLTSDGGWGCQHAMGRVANMVAEAFACGMHISDEGQTIVSRILQNAAGE